MPDMGPGGSDHLSWGLSVRLRTPVVMVMLGTSMGLASACGSVRTVWRDAVPVPGNQPSLQKLEFVERFVTPELWDRMRRAVREENPKLSEEQSKRIALRWKVNRATGENRESVVILVEFSPAETTADPGHVVASCREFLHRELVAALAGGSPVS
jgi:hypothetical protein